MHSPSLPSVTLSADEARARLLSHLRLGGPGYAPDPEGVRALLGELRMIQLDPLAPLGTNADLVAMARAPGLKVGAVYDALLPGHAFEHYAKERCILPASAYPWYRLRAQRAPLLRVAARMEKLPPGAVEGVMAELQALGPSAPKDLTDHGKVQPFDYSGWKGTAQATSMALEVLFARCEVVVSGRGRGGKVYDLPERALAGFPDLGPADPAEGAFERWALTERVAAMGLMPQVLGPHWGLLRDARVSPLPAEMVRRGELLAVNIAGGRRTYLAPPDFLTRPILPPSDAMVLLGPLDPLLWDRKLVGELFHFEYIWEVYKPREKRRWGWYVCPLLHRGALVGRLEGQVEGDRLVIGNVWQEAPGAVDKEALDGLLARHAEAMGAAQVKRPPPSRWRVG